MYEKALETGNSLHRAPPLKETGGGSFTGPFERQMKEGSGNGASLIKLIWAPFFGSRLCWEPESEGNLELL